MLGGGGAGGVLLRRCARWVLCLEWFCLEWFWPSCGRGNRVNESTVLLGSCKHCIGIRDRPLMNMVVGNLT